MTNALRHSWLCQRVDGISLFPATRSCPEIAEPRAPSKDRPLPASPRPAASRYLPAVVLTRGFAHLGLRFGSGGCSQAGSLARIGIKAPGRFGCPPS